MHHQTRLAAALLLAFTPAFAGAAGDLVTVRNAAASTAHVRVYVGRYKLGESDVRAGQELTIALSGNPIGGHLIVETLRGGTRRCTLDGTIGAVVTRWQVNDAPRCVLKRR